MELVDDYYAGLDSRLVRALEEAPTEEVMIYDLDRGIPVVISICEDFISINDLTRLATDHPEFGFIFDPILNYGTGMPMIEVEFMMSDYMVEVTIELLPFLKDQEREVYIITETTPKLAHEFIYLTKPFAIHRTAAGEILLE